MASGAGLWMDSNVLPILTRNYPGPVGPRFRSARPFSSVQDYPSFPRGPRDETSKQDRFSSYVRRGGILVRERRHRAGLTRSSEKRVLFNVFSGSEEIRGDASHSQFTSTEPTSKA